MKRRAVFLDRDGVLVRAAPLKEYAHGPLTLEDFSIFPGVAEPVQRMRDAGFLTVLATNQPGIARGQMSQGDARRDAPDSALGRSRWTLVQACPHRDSDPWRCRKPKPGMLLSPARELDIDLTASYFVGDTARDVDAALACGVTPGADRLAYKPRAGCAPPGPGSGRSGGT
jgi:D-glycero-D-manno-heptose 1,7-bisphosphate phosphatase